MGDALRAYLLYLHLNPSQRIADDAYGGSLFFAAGSGANGDMEFRLSVYELGGAFHASNNPGKPPADVLAHAKEMMRLERAR